MLWWKRLWCKHGDRVVLFELSMPSGVKIIWKCRECGKVNKEDMV